MIDSVDFFIDRDCICTGVGKDGALLQRDCGPRPQRGLLCSTSSSMETTTLATAYHDFTITTFGLNSCCFGQTPKGRCSPDRLYFYTAFLIDRGWDGKACTVVLQDGTADRLINHTNKKRSCIVVDQHISHTHRRSERFLLLHHCFAGTGRESAASRQQRRHAREGGRDALLFCLCLSDDTSIDYGWGWHLGVRFLLMLLCCLSAALLLDGRGARLRTLICDARSD